MKKAFLKRSAGKLCIFFGPHRGETSYKWYVFVKLATIGELCYITTSLAYTVKPSIADSRGSGCLQGEGGGGGLIISGVGFEWWFPC